MAALLAILPLLLGLLSSSAQQKSTETTSPSNVDMNALITLLAESQKPPPPVEIRLPGIIIWLASFSFLFYLLMLTLSVVLPMFGLHSDVLLFATGAMTVLVTSFVNFGIGSSLGSWVKNGWRTEGGGTVIIPPPSPTPTPVPEPEPEPEPPPTPEPEPEPEPTPEPEPLPSGIGRSTNASTATNQQDLPVTSTPASIRYNNPGAQYPSTAAAKFGQTGYGVLKDGNKIASFPHPVNGAASNFDLLSRNYVNMTIDDAGSKWTGGNAVGVPGYTGSEMLTDAAIRDPNTAIPFLRAIAQREAGKAFPMPDDQWRMAHAMFLAGSADAYLAKPGPAPQPTTDLAGRMIAAMVRKGYKIDSGPGEVNIVYVEGLNEDGTINDDEEDKWNDLRTVITFDGDKPVIVGKWVATTEPGDYYTQHPLADVADKGTARIALNQFEAWKVGMHRGDHEALVQRGSVTVYRDLNKDGIRPGDKTDTASDFGINQHGPSGMEEAPDSVGKFSAGCLVGKSMAGHKAFMSIVKADPRFVRDPEYMFKSTVLAEKDVVT